MYEELEQDLTASVAHNILNHEYSVSEVSDVIKMMLEANFENIRIKGEISKITIAPSGHMYFGLKDSKAALKAVCWRNIASQFSLNFEDGMEVICSGSISSYPNGSYYQLIVKKMEVSGIGALLAMLEKRKQTLAQEGLFDIERKKPIPYLPSIIGVVTSPIGAVIRDMLHRIVDRFPVRVIVWEVPVQGKDAAGKIAQAIDGFNAMPPEMGRPDVLIIARGGGSVEDLWAFNEEIVVRATANSAIPTISAIGHETDTSLIDFAADRRAPTPTAAAEIAVPVLADLKLKLTNLSDRLELCLPNLIKFKEFKLERLSLGLRSMENIFDMHSRHLEHLNLRQDNAIHGYMRSVFLKLSTYQRLLESVDYKRVLNRGFALIKCGAGQRIISSVSQMSSKLPIEIELKDGSRKAIVV